MGRLRFDTHMPHDAINESVFLTMLCLKTRLPDIGFTPPLARVAATTAIIFADIVIEQHMKYS